jgi:hypothetical protein
VFKVGDSVLQTIIEYRYLGLILTEHVDYNVRAKHIAKSFNRALCLVISKYKALEGLPFNTYTKLYDSTVWSTLSYDAAIWGDRRMSCITAVQNRALRFVMGVRRYTPNTSVTGDTGWLDAEVKQ